ncbi:MAG: ABC transporter permease [Bacteroidales bacterium]|nr:ABC transporter permease [Bacteroidales bacterium]
MKIIRNLTRHPLNSTIIIISLAVGIACMNLIAMFIYKEYNADSFQKNHDRIYAIYCNDPWINGSTIYSVRAGAAEYIKNNFSEVEDFCRISGATPLKVIAANQDYFDKPNAIAASSNFFNFFSYQLVSDKPESVLATKQDLVISEELAGKYFGTSNPVGQQIKLVGRSDESLMIVSGVFRKPVGSTQLKFDMVRLIGEVDSRCYLLLHQGTDPALLEAKLEQNKALIPILNDGTPNNYYLKDLHSAYLDPTRKLLIENSRSRIDLNIGFVIAFLILSVAMFNYLGLTRNRIIEKTRENSIRRINGGSKTNLLILFMTETSVLLIIAFIISMLLIITILPFFNLLTNSTLSSAFICSYPNFVILLIVMVLIFLITLWFSYFNIAKGTPVELLKKGSFPVYGKVHIPFFYVIQLSVTIVLIVASSVILKQIRYITDKDIGLNKDVLEVRIPQQHKVLTPVFRVELEKYPQIDLVSITNASPVLEHFLLLLRYNDNGIQKEYTPSVFVGDQNYVKTLGVEITEGEDFSENPEANMQKCIINESLAALFPDQNLIGRKLPGDERMTVIGISKDFHYGSLKNFIEPGYVAYGNQGFYLMVKPEKGKEVEVRALISKTWTELIKDFPPTIESIGERYEWMHRENSNYAKLIGSCCFISLFLSMIGLFAVSFNNSRRRVKEIGIRKVNGAQTTEVITLLNQDFIKWVIIAFVIACPLAYYTMNNWLKNYAYKTELSWYIFALAGLLALGIALLTVSWQSWRAATRNPVEALRYE